MRGTNVLLMPFAITFIRITPACAGQILNFFASLVAPAHHPRLRGTNIHLRRKFTIQPGSPPLARDKSFPLPTPRSGIGITPACAGQIVPITYTSIWNWDHPRLRGTNLTPLLLSPLPLGSPPLARDKL